MRNSAVSLGPRLALGAVLGLSAVLLAGCSGGGDRPPATEQPVSTVAQPNDFNGDGKPDLAVAAWDNTAVTVWLGMKTPLLLTPRSPVMPRGIRHAEGFDQVRSGDLDRDGYADLVVHALGDAVPDEYNTVLLWGGPRGLTSSTYPKHLPAIGARERRMTTDPDSTLAPDGDVNHTLALQVDDFDGDKDLDLARLGDDAGPTELFHGPFRRSGAARYITPTRAFGVLEGDSLALPVASGTDADPVVVTNEEQDSHGRQRTSLYTYLGESLLGRRALPAATHAATGDVDCDGLDDLVLSEATRYEGSAPTVPGGDLTVVHGSANGFGEGRATLHVTRDSPGVPGTSHDGSLLGGDHAVADVTGDGCADVLVPNGSEGLLLLRGSHQGLRTTGLQAVTLHDLGLPAGHDGAPNTFTDLRLLDLDSDRYADLVTGPLTDADGHHIAIVAYGTADGFALPGHGRDPLRLPVTGTTEG
jgi:hypothetical protein